MTQGSLWACNFFFGEIIQENMYWGPTQWLLLEILQMSKAKPRLEVSREGMEIYKEPSLKTGYGKYLINKKPWD